MELAVDRRSQVPIFRQILTQLQDQILSGRLPEGFRLPPERRLAEALGVNRSTILAAYRELKADALVDAHVGRGTTVLARPQPMPSPGEVLPPPWRELLREGVQTAQDPSIRDLLALTERGDVISFAVGLPAPELLPIDALHQIFRTLAGEVGGQLGLHCPTEGHSPLRETIAHSMATRGILCTPAEVLIVSGSQQGLDLAARAFLDPGDTVVVEEPTFFGAVQAFRAAQARLVGVPTDDDGMRIDVLQTVIERHRPKLIYTLPTFQNPSGHVMSLQRRRQLLDLAYRHQIPILEDDPYSELRYDGEPMPSLKALDRHGYVLYLSTFSKILFPGLRLGYLVAPRPIARQFALIKQSVDLHSNGIGQWFLDRFLRDGGMAPHLKKVRAAYQERRDVMAEALAPGRALGLTFRPPDGGIYQWCQLPAGVDRQRLLASAAERGVAFFPGASCFVGEPSAEFIRLNFSYPSIAQIRDGIPRLIEALRDALARGAREDDDSAGTPPIV